MPGKFVEPTTIDRTDQEAIERGHADPATGEFSAVLATEGEASDGHILSIRGLEVPDKMPLLAQHSQEHLMGSVLMPKKSYGASPMLRVRPRIELEGDTRAGDFRRDAFHMINAGHLTGMSLRWDTQKATRRVNLPSDHKAFVDAAKIDENDPARWGYFIEKAQAREGSLVALGADQAAQVSRSDSGSLAATTLRILAREQMIGVDADDAPPISAAVRELQEKLETLRELGIDDIELAELLSGGNLTETHPYRYLDEGGSLRTARIPCEAWDALDGESQRERELLLELQDEARAAVTHMTERDAEVIELRQKVKAGRPRLSADQRRELHVSLRQDMRDYFGSAMAERLYQRDGRL